jgi:hypothetical protein
MSDCNESKGPKDAAGVAGIATSLRLSESGYWTIGTTRTPKMKYEEVEAAEKAADEARAKMFETYVAYIKSHGWEPVVDYAQCTALWKHPNRVDSEPQTLEDAVSYEHNIGLMEKDRAEQQIRKLKAEHGIGGEV